jgi:hypothetical protein
VECRSIQVQHVVANLNLDDPLTWAGDQACSAGQTWPLAVDLYHRCAENVTLSVG